MPALSQPFSLFLLFSLASCAPQFFHLLIIIITAAAARSLRGPFINFYSLCLLCCNGGGVWECAEGGGAACWSRACFLFVISFTRHKRRPPLLLFLTRTLLRLPFAYLRACVSHTLLSYETHMPASWSVVIQTPYRFVRGPWALSRVSVCLSSSLHLGVCGETGERKFILICLLPTTKAVAAAAAVCLFVCCSSVSNSCSFMYNFTIAEFTITLPVRHFSKSMHARAYVFNFTV